MKKYTNAALLLLLFVFAQTLTTFAQQDSNNTAILSFDDAKIKVEDFINKIIISSAVGRAKVKNISEEGCLYKISVDINGQEYISYMSKDGKKFFQSGRDINSEMKKYVDDHTIIKSAKPTVELFVMSYCPYGMQIEKGILPVLATLGDKINFELKFCSYAMHDKKELTEQIREYCIQQQGPQLLLNYLTCFLEEGKSDECIAKVGVDTIKMNRSIVEVEKKYKIMEQYNDKSAWYMNKYPQFNIYKEDNIKYDLKGSPNLIINGKKMLSGRDSESLLKLICSAFNNPPEECNVKLSSTNLAPGLGHKIIDGSTPNYECNGNDN